MTAALCMVLAYLIGALPFGVIAGKLLKGIDVREYGSGRMGATNVMRTLGWKVSITILILDMGKGVAAVFIARAFSEPKYVEALAGLAAVVGHNWPVYVKFKGGRGVSPGLGGLFALVPPVGAIALGVGLVVIAATRFVSFGSMCGAVSGFLGTLVLALTGRQSWEYLAYTAVVVPLIIIQHRDNIARLIRGEERKFGKKAEAAAAKAAERPVAGRQT